MLVRIIYNNYGPGGHLPILLALVSWVIPVNLEVKSRLKSAQRAVRRKPTVTVVWQPSDLPRRRREPGKDRTSLIWFEEVQFMAWGAGRRALASGVLRLEGGPSA